MTPAFYDEKPLSYSCLLVSDRASVSLVALKTTDDTSVKEPLLPFSFTWLCTSVEKQSLHLLFSECFL